jgi:hypothetical protein
VTIRLATTAAVLTLLLGACSKSSTTSTTPSDPSSPAPKFTATLLPSNEVPAVTNGDAAATGTMTITFNLTKDAAGNVTAATADFSGTYSGFPNGTSLTASHIHPGVAGSNGSPVVNLGLAAGEVTFPTGSGTLTKNGITMTVDQANSILANPGAFYFNSHTALNPGGAVRGQLVRTQ